MRMTRKAKKRSEKRNSKKTGNFRSIAFELPFYLATCFLMLYSVVYNIDRTRFLNVSISSCSMNIDRKIPFGYRGACAFLFTPPRHTYSLHDPINFMVLPSLLFLGQHRCLISAMVSVLRPISARVSLIDDPIRTVVLLPVTLTPSVAVLYA